MPSELPDNLKSLAAGLDALAGRASASPEADSLPTLDGTDFEPFAELGRGGMGVVHAALAVRTSAAFAQNACARFPANGGTVRAVERLTRAIAFTGHRGLPRSGGGRDSCHAASFVMG